MGANNRVEKDVAEAMNAQEHSFSGDPVIVAKHLGPPEEKLVIDDTENQEYYQLESDTDWQKLWSRLLEEKKQKVTLEPRGPHRGLKVREVLPPALVHTIGDSSMAQRLTECRNIVAEIGLDSYIQSCKVHTNPEVRDMINQIYELEGADIYWDGKVLNETVSDVLAGKVSFADTRSTRTNNFGVVRIAPFPFSAEFTFDTSNERLVFSVVCLHDKEQWDEMFQLWRQLLDLNQPMGVVLSQYEEGSLHRQIQHSKISRQAIRVISDSKQELCLTIVHGNRRWRVHLVFKLKSRLKQEPYIWETNNVSIGSQVNSEGFNESFQRPSIGSINMTRGFKLGFVAETLRVVTSEKRVLGVWVNSITTRVPPIDILEEKVEDMVYDMVANSIRHEDIMSRFRTIEELRESRIREYRSRRKVLPYEFYSDVFCNQEISLASVYTFVQQYGKGSGLGAVYPQLYNSTTELIQGPRMSIKNDSCRPASVIIEGSKKDKMLADPIDTLEDILNLKNLPGTRKSMTSTVWQTFWDQQFESGSTVMEHFEPRGIFRGLNPSILEVMPPSLKIDDLMDDVGQRLAIHKELIDFISVESIARYMECIARSDFEFHDLMESISALEGVDLYWDGPVVCEDTISKDFENLKFVQSQGCKTSCFGALKVALYPFTAEFTFDNSNERLLFSVFAHDNYRMIQHWKRFVLINSIQGGIISAETEVLKAKIAQERYNRIKIRMIIRNEPRIITTIQEGVFRWKIEGVVALKTKSKNKSEFWESGRNDACGPILDMSRGFEYAFHKGSTRVLESEKNVFGVWVSTQLEDPCAETVSQELKVVMDADKSTIHDKTVNNNVNDYNETIDSIRKKRHTLMKGLIQLLPTEFFVDVYHNPDITSNELIDFFDKVQLPRKLENIARELLTQGTRRFSQLKEIQHLMVYLKQSSNAEAVWLLFWQQYVILRPSFPDHISVDWSRSSFFFQQKSYINISELIEAGFSKEVTEDPLVIRLFNLLSNMTLDGSTRSMADGVLSQSEQDYLGLQDLDKINESEVGFKRNRFSMHPEETERVNENDYRIPVSHHTLVVTEEDFELTEVSRGRSVHIWNENQKTVVNTNSRERTGIGGFGSGIISHDGLKCVRSPRFYAFLIKTPQQ